MLKQTTSIKVEESIKKAFEFDNEMVNLYDPIAVNITKEEIPSDIYRKLKEYESHGMKLDYYDFFIGDKFCGYVAICKERKMLVSFGLCLRDKETKDSFFEDIKKVLDYEFICILNKRNERGVKWLVKMGMEKEGTDYEYGGHPFVVLKYLSKFKV